MKTKSGFEYDFGGWATKNDLTCSDGRTIRKNAFAKDDGRIVPLVYMHQHDSIENVLGHALLENREDGVWAYCSFNDTPNGQIGKQVVAHKDIVSLSIWANRLDERNGNVMHGSIKEVSIVLAGANPGAVIDFPYFAHSDEEDTSEAFIRVDEPIDYTPGTVKLGDEDDYLQHDDEDKGDEKTVQDVINSMNEEQRQALEYLVGMALSGESVEHADNNAWNSLPGENFSFAHSDEGTGRTVGDVLDTMDNDQRKVTEYLVATALQSMAESGDSSDDNSDDVEHSDMEADDDIINHSEEGDDENMKFNSFESFGDTARQDPKTYLTHAEGVEIVKMAKEHHMSLKNAIDLYAKENGKELMHADNDLGFKDIDRLFPDYKLVNPGAPEMIEQDQTWVSKVINGTRKSPMSRLRTRYVDARDTDTTPDGLGLRPRGYKKGTMKTYRGNLDLFGRTTDPVTVYVKSKLDRDDIVDITDFNIVDYMYQMDRRNMNLEVARQILIGDGRNGDEEDSKAIDPTKIRPIWLDDDLYCIHELIDVQGMRTTLNGSDSSKHFGDNYVLAEAVIQTLLYAREKYKGSGNPALFIHPHLVNVMLLARDLNGRRIYDNVSELKSALNVSEIITVEQFEGKTRTATVDDGNGGTTNQTRKLMALLVNMSDYTVGATKGGELTHFTDFDLNFNQEISLLETRFSGALLKPWSAIALEELVNP